MDTSLFLTLFLFAVQIAVGVAPVRWMQHTWLAGWIFYLSGFFAFVCLIWWTVSNQDWLMQHVQPSQVVALGLAVALAGLVWQWLRVSVPDPQTVRLQSEINSLRQELANFKKPTNSTSQAPVSKATYNERDIRELLDSLDEASDVVEKRMLPTVTAITTAMANWYSAIPNLGVKGAAEQFKMLKGRLHTDVWDPLNAIVYGPPNRHPDELRYAFALDHEAPKGELSRSMQVAIQALEKLPENPSEPTRDLVKPQFNEAYRQGEIAYNWLVTVKSRIAEMKANLKTQGVTGFAK